MNPNDKSDSPKKKNPLEWAVFGLSLVILCGVIGALIHEALTLGDDPALLSVEMGNPLVSHGQVRLPLHLGNAGDLPAIAVEVEVTGNVEGEEFTSSAQFDYIPHRATRTGWVSFPGETIPADLSARVLGYADP